MLTTSVRYTLFLVASLTSFVSKTQPRSAANAALVAEGAALGDYVRRAVRRGDDATGGAPGTPPADDDDARSVVSSSSTHRTERTVDNPLAGVLEAHDQDPHVMHRSTADGARAPPHLAAWRARVEALELEHAEHLQVGVAGC